MTVATKMISVLNKTDTVIDMHSFRYSMPYDKVSNPRYKR